MVCGVGPFCSLADRPIDDYEWEYGRQFQPTSPSEPRTASLDSILETAQQQVPPQVYPEYTTAAPAATSVDEITHSLDQIRISSPASSFISYTAPTFTPAVENTASFGRYIKTRNPHALQEEFDPRESSSGQHD
jgi:hypothetical protein